MRKAAITINNVEDTYEFVRATRRDEFFAAHNAEIKRLVGDDGAIRPEFAEPVAACPICDASEHEVLFRKQGFVFKDCRNPECRHIYADPQINHEALMAAYRGAGTGKGGRTASDIWMDVLLSNANQQYDRAKYQRGMDAIEAALETGSGAPFAVLDVGCSVGIFLDTARERGWRTMGVELNERAVDYAVNTLKLDVRKALLEECGFAEASFDAVTLWGVIEHLKQPLPVLREIYRILKPGGVFVTFCPNGSSLACRVLREKAATFDGRNHPHNFTPTSIRLAMRMAGFEPLAISFHQPDIDAVINHIEGRDPYLKGEEGAGPLKQLFSGPLRAQAEDFLENVGLGYKMMTLNRKPKP
ncbi:methyltransferase type 12 [Alkalidesulfovibrio alkalitolerans DSM 16529]|uniref:Methyltransferase type 12 n=1 Tax=Alkalidesulfovibrio alkalitolerans DSM 16529 TaxID=1121439 RepID=S7UNF2_9BACT|nr:class I SAM-dependent methyltransferase [Alkalidesulfovibrio alkalitolerans]EPR35549.1 methyltransferase type 12 [Alkalidesulfovibrio alkalitolerans DSM 16529]